MFGGYLHQVNTHDLGAAEDVHWFDDQDVVGQPNATDLGDGELSAASKRSTLAAAGTAKLTLKKAVRVSR